MAILSSVLLTFETQMSQPISLHYLYKVNNTIIIIILVVVRYQVTREFSHNRLNGTDIMIDSPTFPFNYY